MAHRIETTLKRGLQDPRSGLIIQKAEAALGLKIADLQMRTVYKIDHDLTPAELTKICQAFAHPVLENSAPERLPPPKQFDCLIEIGFKPGVTDNAGRVALYALRDILNQPLPEPTCVYTATQYIVTFRNSAPKPATQARRLALGMLANPLLHTIQIYTAAQWQKASPDTEIPLFKDQPSSQLKTFNLQGADKDLLRISSENTLSCSLEEMRAIRDYFNQPDVMQARQALGLPADPTDVEIECIAQTWSEHCSHKIFAARIEYSDETGKKQTINSLYKTFIKDSTKKISQRRDWLVSVFTDNAGVIKFDSKRHLVYKAETHNSPSALDPYGGAMTGVIGVNRDPMGTGMGAALLCNIWGYCLGSPFYKKHLPAGLLHPRYIRDGAHQGVIEGGNQSGLPWMRGWEVFDDRFIGKPLVFCGTVGTLPVKVNQRPSERKEILPGDALVMLGGRIGRDGIHGATFSSEELREKSPPHAVQIGDPLTQRKMYEFLLEARDKGLYRCITDNGAGGLSCSAGEMGNLAGGVELDLALAPLKYEGLQPWEILLSEAQERMTLAVQPNRMKAFLRLAKRRDVEASVLGKFTDSGVYLIRHGEKVVGRLDMHFLYRGCPTLELKAVWEPPKVNRPKLPLTKRRDTILIELLQSLNLCSKEFKSRQYDSEVKGLSVVKPYVGIMSDMPADATVMRIDYKTRAGIVLAEGINPFYSDLDTHAMASSVIDEAVRRAISAGADPDHLAGLDNFCWPDPVESEKTPDGPYKLAQLVRACQALYDTTTAYGVPCISGKDSCKNDSTRGGRKISIPPTLLFSTIGKIPDVRRAVTMDVKFPGDLVYLIGLTHPELGASAYYRLLAKKQKQPENIGGKLPSLDTETAQKTYRALHTAINQELINSSHTPTKGGLAAALALAALGGDLGLETDLGNLPATNRLNADEKLFSESNSRFVITVNPQKASLLEDLLQEIPYARIGKVCSHKLLMINDSEHGELVKTNLKTLRSAFKQTLAGL